MSKVAAGMINLITGRRIVLTWRFLDAWNFLVSDYPKWESLLGVHLFHKKPVVRFLKSEEDRDLFLKKCHREEFSGVRLRYRKDCAAAQVFEGDLRRKSGDSFQPGLNRRRAGACPADGVRSRDDQRPGSGVAIGV